MSAVVVESRVRIAGEEEYVRTKGRAREGVDEERDSGVVGRGGNTGKARHHGRLGGSKTEDGGKFIFPRL